ncbi:lipase family protein [Paraburkholderia sp. A3RO-2L]|uniref:lipase family protein n=1 Tax=Paraburkholderia sp. A3RO-2L TaxID=3028376 RepID=UPI003DA97059
MTPRDFALFAQEAYSAAPDIGKPDSASRAIVRQTAAGLVVAFPGTDNLPCVGADINIALMAVAGAGDVHRGFWDAWKAISAPVMDVIGAQPVILVGHSLGAAIAIMAAVEMTLAGRAPAAVYGFEPPRVSPGLGVRTLLANVRVSLFKNGGDLVPDLPLGWNHAALLMHIGRPALPNVPDHLIARVIQSLSVA